MVKSQTDTTRESMWSVSSRFRPLYGVVFFSLFAFGIYTILSMARDCVAWRACVVEIVGHVAGMAIAAGAVSLVLIDLVGACIVLTEWLIDKRAKKQQELKERYIQEGRELERKEARERKHRREEHDASQGDNAQES